MIVLIMLIRWTIPRFRFDQLMGLAWKVLIPLSLANVVIVMTVLQFDWNRWWLLAISIGLFVDGGRDRREREAGGNQPPPTRGAGDERQCDYRPTRSLARLTTDN